MVKNQKKAKVINYVLTGPIKDLESFIGRKPAIDSFFDMFNGFHPFVPRKVVGVSHFGKTSFLYYISNPKVYKEKISPEGKNTKFLYLYVKNFKKPETFWHALHSGLCELFSTSISVSEIDNFNDFNVWLKDKLKKHRFVILLDEFDSILQSSEFDSNFFLNIRFLISDKFIWIVSRKGLDLSRSNLEKIDSEANYFLNYCLQSPIFIDLLNELESEQLITGPARSQGVIFPKEHILAIQELAGGVPIFLQHVAQRWLSIYKIKGSDPMQIYVKVRDEMLRPGEVIREQIDEYWKGLLKIEKKILLQAAINELNVSAKTNDSVQILILYGFLCEKNDQLIIPSNLFKYWIIKYSNFERIETGKITSDSTLQPKKLSVNIFICYSEKNMLWMEEIKKYLSINYNDIIVNVLTDQVIEAGQDKQKEIFNMINNSNIIILLISIDFLNSKIILDEQLPVLLEREKQHNIKICPIICESVPILHIEFLKHRQCRPLGNEPLSSIEKNKRNDVLIEITREIFEIAKRLI